MKMLLAALASLFVSSGVAHAEGSIYDFSVKTIEGEQQSLSAYKGNVLLIVNTASKCGFTKQYTGLQSVYEKYADQGLVVLGFPSNNFGRQEPGTNEQIAQFCSLTYHVTFPMFGKISVKGKEVDPLYAWLTTHPKGDKVSWNFNKFIVGRNGELVSHWGSRAAPESEKLLQAIQTELSKK